MGDISPIEQFIRDIGDEYLVLMSPGRFDDAMVASYLKTRPGVSNYTDAQIDLIARFTKGLPLAVTFTATLLDQGQTVEDACKEIDDGRPSSVISRLARRYLVHAEKQSEQQNYPGGDPQQADVTKILGLALAFGDLRNDPEMLAALWDVEDPLVEFGSLARRHDFVLPVSRRLHDDVPETLRLDLLDPYRRTRVRQINQRALALLRARLERMRSRWLSLDDQLDHTEFTGTLLALLWHTFWLDNQTGFDLFIHVLPILAVGDPATANAAVSVAEQFAGTFNPDLRRDLEFLTTLRPEVILDDSSPPARGQQRRRLDITMPRLSLNPVTPKEDDFVIGGTTDREASLMILRASLRAREGDQEAIAMLEIAAAHTTSSRLRQAIGSQALALANRLIWAGPQGAAVPSTIGLAAAKLAVSMLSDNASAWDAYGVALRNANCPEDAVAALDQSLALDPSRAATHVNRGVAFAAQGRYTEALVAYEQVLAWNPENVTALVNRAHALNSLRRFEEALAAYNNAVAFGLGTPNVYVGRARTLHDLGRHEEALAAYERVLAEDPDNTIAVLGRGHTLRDLGRFEDAMAAYERVLAEDPDNTIAVLGRGHTLNDLGRFEDAMAAYERVLAEDPDNTIAVLGRGHTLRDLGRFEDALAAYERALAQDADNAYNQCGRANTLVTLGRFEEAIAAYDRAIALEPDSRFLHENKGIALAVIGQLDSALAEFGISNNLAPTGGGEGAAWAGAILWHRKDKASANRWFARVQGRVTECTPFRTAEMEAIALCALGKPVEAEILLREALHLRAPGDRGEPRAIYNLLSDPLLPGINRLREIAENDT